MLVGQNLEIFETYSIQNYAIGNMYTTLRPGDEECIRYRMKHNDGFMPYERMQKSRHGLMQIPILEIFKDARTITIHAFQQLKDWPLADLQVVQ